jgi:hypothetical protein
MMLASKKKMAFYCLAFVLALTLLQSATARRQMLGDTAILGGASSFNFGFSSGAGNDEGPDTTVAEVTTAVGSSLDSDEDVSSLASADSEVLADQVGAEATAFVYGDDSTSSTDVELTSTYPTRSGIMGFVNADAKSAGAETSYAASSGHLYSSNDVYESASFGSSLAYALSNAVGTGGDATESETYIEVQTETEAIPLPGWNQELGFTNPTAAQGEATTGSQAMGGERGDLAASASYVLLVTDAEETQGPTQTDLVASAEVDAQSTGFGALSSETETTSSVSALGYADENGGSGSTEHAVGSGQASGSGAVTSQSGATGVGFTGSSNEVFAYVQADGGLGVGVSDYDQTNGVSGHTAIGFSNAVGGGSALSTAQGSDASYSDSFLTGGTSGAAEAGSADGNGEALVSGESFGDVDAQAQAAGYGRSATEIEGLATSTNLLAASTSLQGAGIGIGIVGTTGGVVASGDFIGGGFIDAKATGSDVTKANAQLFGDVGGDASAYALHGNAAGMGYAGATGLVESDAHAAGVGSSLATIEGLVYGEAESVIETQSIMPFSAEVAESQATAYGASGTVLDANALGDVSSVNGMMTGGTTSGAIAAVSGSEFALGSGAEGSAEGESEYSASQDTGDFFLGIASIDAQSHKSVASEASVFGAVGGGEDGAGYLGEGSSMAVADGLINGNIIGDDHSGSADFQSEASSYTLEEEQALLGLLEGYSGSGAGASGAAFANLAGDYVADTKYVGGMTLAGESVAASSIMSQGVVGTDPDDSTAISATADLTASGYGDGSGTILANGDYASKDISVGGDSSASVAGATSGVASWEALFPENFGLAGTTAGAAGESGSNLHLSVTGGTDGLSLSMAGVGGVSGAYANLDGKAYNNGATGATVTSGGFGSTQASAETDAEYGALSTMSGSSGSTVGAAETLNEEDESSLTEYGTIGAVAVEISGEGEGPMKHNTQTGVDTSGQTGILTDVGGVSSISVVDAGAGIVGTAETDAWEIDVAGWSDSETTTGIHTPSQGGLSPLIIDPNFYGPGRITDEDWFFVNLADSLGVTVGTGSKK